MIPSAARFAFVCALLVVSFDAAAQFTVSGQLRTRTEFRDGQGTPLPKGAAPAFFTSQRSRLSLFYNTYRLKFNLTLQDVRVWGQDVSTINRTTTADNNGLMLHEAWAEIGITDTTDKKHNLSLRAGRQELVFDDQRLIGNLDWLQQARRHDAAVFRYNAGKWSAQAGLAFNQNRENAAGTIYSALPPGNYTASTNGGNMYKSFEFLYINRKLHSGSASFLLFADQFNRFGLDSGVKVYAKGAWSRFTGGFYLNNQFDRWLVTASAYYQTGRTALNQILSAGLLSANAYYDFSRQLSIGPGIDFTSGGSSANRSHAFDPLYGTPHKFWGLMDYFYAGSPFGSRGLVDYYLKSKYVSGKWQATADVHQFFSASPVSGPDGLYRSRNFGTEADFTLVRPLTAIITFETGYSHFFSTGSLAAPPVKNASGAKNNSDWAYLMIVIKPVFLTK